VRVIGVEAGQIVTTALEDEPVFRQAAPIRRDREWRRSKRLGTRAGSGSASPEASAATKRPR
jgi:hypothetical protein